MNDGTPSPSGHMKLRSLKAYGFEDVTVVGLATKINDFTAGKASGGYAAGEVGEATYISTQFRVDGTKYVALVEYAK